MSRTIDPIVSTEWLEARLAGGCDQARVQGREGDVAQGSALSGELVVVDIREPRFYKAGHIPSAISIPFAPVSDWAVATQDLHMELPEPEQLFKVIGDPGICAHSQVVVVTTVEQPPAPPYSLSDATRVAATLIYAGVSSVAVLDGGHPKWEREGRRVTTEVPATVPVPYAAAVRRDMFVPTEYVEAQVGRATLVDGRVPDQYFGVTVDPFAGKAGHIPTARCLPASWIWREDGTYRTGEELERIAVGVIGEDREQEIIAYCGVGGYASAWWFVLTEILGYKNVKIYDGAMEAWAKEKVIACYRWEG